MDQNKETTRVNVLVIDDEPDISSYISSILEGHQYSVSTCNSAINAESIIDKNLPDLILLDLMMPGKTGIQLFTKLKKNEKTKDIPMIMVTGIKEKLNIDWKEITSRFKARVPDGFVEKPIEPLILMNVVEDVLSKCGDKGPRS